jgi:biotin transport system substrate-specific component
VPVTLQSFFTIMAGALLGGRYGALSQLVYVLLGAFGLPVFAGGSSGFGVLVGPTGGYLFGFVLGALVAGTIAGGEAKASKSLTWSYIRILLGLVVGTVVIYTIGVIQLSLVLRKGFVETLSIGVFPFLIGDSLKIAVATLAVRNVRRFVG